MTPLDPSASDIEIEIHYDRDRSFRHTIDLTAHRPDGAGDDDAGEGDGADDADRGDADDDAEGIDDESTQTEEDDE
jgi:hypothetical protein